MQRLLQGDDLRAALKAGRLKPDTLVWKRGMKCWVPAESLPELMPDAEDDDTLVAQSTIDHDDLRSTAKQRRPSNMVDIGSLRGSKSMQATMIGVGNDTASAAGLVLPPAPRLPHITSNKAPALDGGWSEGAARHDDDEQTVTRIRHQQDEATALRRMPTKRPPAPHLQFSAKRKGSSRPPPPPRSRRKVSRGTKTLTSPEGKRKPSIPAPPPVQVVSARPQLDSGEVLSAAFEGGGRPRGGQPAPLNTHTMVSGAQRARATQQGHAVEQHVGHTVAGPTVRKGSRTQRPALPTAPLPEVRPGDIPGPPPPTFASEPWIPPAPPAPNIPGTSTAAQGLPEVQVGLRQAFIPTDTPSAPRGPLPSRVVVRSPIFMGAAGSALVLLIVAFVVGRCTASDSEDASVVRARVGLAAVPLFARSRTGVHSKPRPCLMLRAPSRWSATAYRRVAVEVAAGGDAKLGVGFAASATEPRGLVINPGSGVIDSRYAPEKVRGTISRVVPVPRKDEMGYGITLTNQAGVKSASYVAMGGAFIVGFTDDKVVRASEPGSDPTPLWDLTEGKRTDALRLVHIADQGVGVVYRHDGRIWYGLLDEDGGVKHEGAIVAGSGGKVGKPNIASNGRLVSLVFADKPPGKGAPIEIRWARGPIGKPLSTARTVSLPEGGPGGDAIAPAVAALSGGRWLLMWTEGRSGRRTLRAQTYGASFKPVGAALRVSPATGNFGQGVVGVAGESAAVAFLLATRKGYQLWGTVLQCE